MYKHQRVWKEATDKELPAGWIVHHLNGDHNDNRADNLVALPKHIHDSLNWVSMYFRRLNETPNLFNTMLLQLSKEQRSQKVRNVGGKIRHKGYKRKSGEYNWIRTTIDELERVISNMKQMDYILNSLRSK